MGEAIVCFAIGSDATLRDVLSMSVPMICISIAQESRTLALVDMLNAVALGADMVELRLDCFEKDPNLAELFTAKRVPILMSCKRPEDGGNWDADENERLMLLRNAVINNCDYVEIEHDVADQIRPYPPSQRVISYTNLKETPADIADIYAEMATKKPDIIQLTCRALTPEAAWPLVQILAKPVAPTVVVGLGRPGLMLAILGAKFGAPWTVAALERGMEVYPGQPTIRDLDQIYQYRSINKATKFVGVTGLGESELLTTGLMNAAFAQLGVNVRCLPMQVGNWKVFRKIIDAVKLLGVVVEEAYQESVYQIASYDESAKAPIQAADMLLAGGESGWQGANLFGTAAVEAIRAALSDTPETVAGRMFCIAGAGPAARMLASAIKAEGGSLIFAAKNREASQRLSQLFGGRQIAFEGLYTTSHDVLIVPPGAAEDVDDEEGEKPAVHPGYLRKGMTVMDLTRMPRRSALLREALSRGCSIVDPRRLLVEQTRQRVQRIIGREVAAEPLMETLAGWLADEED